MSAKLWGGRFKKDSMDELVMKFTSSLDVDKILLKYDCLSTKVHVEMLEKAGYVTPKERKEIARALDQLIKEHDKMLVGVKGYEDIHSFVQDYVESKAPQAAKKMHTGRSRNEQVVNDVRLYCMEEITAIRGLIAELQASLVGLAEDNINVIIPGYTHLNHAQPILFSHLVMSYVEMLERDAARLSDARKRVDVSVMGSGAIAGSALSLDREFTARKSGFSGISANSIDSVSDRDFMVEIVSAISMLGVHLSRISEDFILYSTGEFGFIDIGEEYCTGSSLMPQKKNADVLELARGRSSFFIGALASLLTLLKGLPHAYNRDLQEDKRHLFESVSAIKDELLVLSRLVGTIIVEESGVAAQMEDEFLLSTDIAEYLVQKGIPFREAHAVVGAMVRYCIDKGKGFTGMDVRELKGFSDAIGDDFSGILSPEYSVKNKKTPGGTNPEHVGREIKRWKRKLEM